VVQTTIFFDQSSRLRERRRRSAKPAIARLLLNEVIPILQRPAASEVGAEDLTPQTAKPPELQSDVDKLAELLLRHRLREAHELVLLKRQENVPLHGLCLNLLAPTAQKLGEFWVKDRCDFNTVTVGVGSLQRLMREIHLLSAEPQRSLGQHHSILLLPAPGEQHSFGVSMLGEFFHSAGWETAGGPAIGRNDLQQILTQQTYDVVGLSIASDRWLSSLVAAIEAVRTHCKNPNVKILVGGPLFARSTSAKLAREIGVDGFATDADGAVHVAEQLVATAAE